MTNSPIALGVFDLLEPVGSGSTGQVWRGAHRPTADLSLPVAVKIVDVEAARDEALKAVFRREVQAVAALDHPRIVRVFDYGSVPREAEKASGGELVADSPYLVMEFLGGGTLHHYVGALRWPSLRSSLLGLLDALAHSHARGVLHRDIKPGNVLIGDRGVILSDFGLGQALVTDENEPELGLLEGTPAYMSPEQFECRWRDYGPWTDLYALGCLAYTLASGSPPFGRRVEFERSMFGHLYQDLPPLEAQMEVPSGFEPWLRRLMAKHPSDRFQWAADAALALAALEGAGSLSISVSGSASPLTEDEAPTLHMEGPMSLSLPHELDPELMQIFRHASRTSTSDSSMSPVLVPPLPMDWHQPEPSYPSPRMSGVGLGVYGLRTIPMVDRENERDALWENLHVVRDTATPRMVVLRGPAGVGKSRLAEWLCERSHELGGATVLRAYHSPLPGSRDGVGPMLDRHLRCTGLSADAVASRVASWLEGWVGVSPEGEAGALTELICSAHGNVLVGRGSSGLVGSPMGRNLLVERFIGRLAARRPVVLWLDDVQWGLDALFLCKHLLGRERDSPRQVLIVVTVRDEVLPDQHAAVELLGELLAFPTVTEVVVGPLSPEDRPQLVQHLLGMEGELANRIEERTAGNPLFAVQLVADWVQRGILLPKEEGFGLRPGSAVQLPDDLQQVWDEPIERLLEGRSPSVEASLELAAVLGRDVAYSEWAQACDAEGLEVPSDLVDALVTRGLAEVSWEAGAVFGWSFVHEMFREALKRRAWDQGRAAGFHRTCAAMLRSRPGADVVRRQARHLLAAGDDRAALGPLLEAGLGLVHQGELRQAQIALEQRCEAMDRLELPSLDGARIEGDLARTELAREQGAFDLALELASRARDHATELGLHVLVADAMAHQGALASTRGELIKSRELFQDALVLYQEHGDLESQTRCQRALAMVLVFLGEGQESEMLYKKVLAEYERAHNPYGRTTALIGLIRTALLSGRLKEAESRAAQAVKLCRHFGFRVSLAHAHNMTGEVQRNLGNFQGAEGAYRRALDLYSAVGSPDADIAGCNLALILVHQRRYDEALPHLESMLRSFESKKRSAHAGLVLVAMLPCFAAAGSWDSWDLHLSRAIQILQDASMVEPDIAQMATLGGELALEVNELQRARAAYELASSQWQTMGREAEAADLARRLAALPDADG